MSYADMKQNTKFPKTKAAFEAATVAAEASRKVGKWKGYPQLYFPWNSPTWEPAYTYTTSYCDWESQLGHHYWHAVMRCTGDVFQLNFLRGITVAGVSTSDWPNLFYKFNEGSNGWDRIKKRWIASNTMPQVDDFFQLIVNDYYYTTHYPAVYPEWLVPYGFTQQQYISDLGQFWFKVADVYYELWPDTRYGFDTPEIAAIRRIGQEARQEMEGLYSHASQYVQADDEYDNDDDDDDDEIEPDVDDARNGSFYDYF